MESTKNSQLGYITALAEQPEEGDSEAEQPETGYIWLLKLAVNSSNWFFLVIGTGCE